MDCQEAGRLLREQLVDHRKLSYDELVARIGNDEYLQVRGPSDVEYQIEIQFMWDSKEDGDLRVVASIDDGSFRGTLGTSVRNDALHASAVDSQLLAEHGDFEFELMNPGLLDIAVLEQRFATREHGDSHDPNHIEHRISNERLPRLRKAQRLDIIQADFIKHGGNWKSPTITGPNCQVGMKPRRLKASVAFPLGTSGKSAGCAPDSRPE